MVNALNFEEKVFLASCCCSRCRHLFPNGVSGLASQLCFAALLTNAKSWSVERLGFLHHKYCLFRRKRATPELWSWDFLIIVCQNGGKFHTFPAKGGPGLFVEEIRPLSDVSRAADLFPSWRSLQSKICPNVSRSTPPVPGEHFSILWVSHWKTATVDLQVCAPLFVSQPQLFHWVSSDQL